MRMRFDTSTTISLVKPYNNSLCFTSSATGLCPIYSPGQIISLKLQYLGDGVPEQVEIKSIVLVRSPSVRNKQAFPQRKWSRFRTRCALRVVDRGVHQL